MRKWSLLALAPLLLVTSEVGATDSFSVGSSTERLMLPVSLGGPTLTDDSITKRAYVNSSNELVMFFTGSKGHYTVHFIDASGLIDLTHIQSEEGRKALDPNSEDWREDERANSSLSATGLPDREFRAIPVQGGFLTEVQYGKLFFVSYVATGSDQLKLKLGTQIDMGVLARLTREAGIDGSIKVVPLVNGPTETIKVPAWIQFTSVPDKLFGLVSANAPALFNAVSGRDEAWEVSPLPPPSSLSDTAAIEAIRVQLVGNTYSPEASMYDSNASVPTSDAVMNAAPDDSSDMVQNAAP